VVVFSLLSKLALKGVLPTRAIPLLVWLPFSHACTAEVTSMWTYWFLSAAVSDTLAAIWVPRVGALSAVIALSDQVLST